LLQSEGGKQTEPALASLPEQAHLMNGGSLRYLFWWQQETLAITRLFAAEGQVCCSNLPRFKGDVSIGNVTLQLAILIT